MAEATDVPVKSVTDSERDILACGDGIDTDNLDNTIISEIRKLKAKKKRADFIAISTCLEQQLGLARSTTHQHMLQMTLNGKIECSLAIPKSSQRKQNIVSEVYPPENDPIASLLENLKSNEDVDKTTKRRQPKEPADVGPPQTNKFLETVNELAKSLQKTNDKLCMELETSRKYMEEKFQLLEENSQLKIKLRDLEIFHARKQVSPTLQRQDTFVLDSLENNASEVSTMKQVGKARKNNNKVTRNEKDKEEILRSPRTNNNKLQHRKKENKQHEKRKSQRLSSHQAAGKPVHICMVGDSQLLRLDAEKMSNNHHEVILNAKSGMKVEEASEYVDPDADVLILHAGTNNLRDSTPSELAEKVVRTLKKMKQKNPKAQLVYSSIFRRKGKGAVSGMNVKVFETNKLLKEELGLQSIDYLDNDNILYGNICDDGLHINQGGAKRFARNIRKYVEYW